MAKKRKGKNVTDDGSGAVTERPADIPILPDDHIRVFGPPDTDAMPDDVSGDGDPGVTFEDVQLAFRAGIRYAAHFLRREHQEAHDLAEAYDQDADDLAAASARLRTLR